MNDPKAVLTAVVSDVRTELKLINPDYRRVGRMLADGFDALLEHAEHAEHTEHPDRAEHVPEPPEIRNAEPPEVRSSAIADAKPRNRKRN